MKCPKCHLENTSDSAFCRKCGTRFDSPDQASFTKTLEAETEGLARRTLFAGRYEVIEELGQGGMGRVYRVFDTRIKEEVALKLLRPEVASHSRTIERFRNEIRLARKIVHKNVCRMFDMGEEQGTQFITMEYVSGEDLKSFIRRIGQLPAGKAVFIGREIAEGLAEAHKIGVVHRDLKPGNIMIDKDGDAKIMDFGIARSLTGGGTTVEGAIIGTPEYMSPEQVDGKEADARTDIYALGVILFEMVTGRVPFEGRTPFSIATKHKTEPPPDPTKFNPQIPPDLGRVILRCMEKSSEERYQTTGELLSDLESIEAALPTTDRAATRAASRTRPRTSRSITVSLRPNKFVISAAALLVLAAALILWRPWSQKTVAPAPSAKPSLAILNFENFSTDPDLKGWETAFPLLLMTDLSQIKEVRVLSDDAVLSVYKKLGLADAGRHAAEDLKRIGVEGNVTHTLSGSLMRAGEKVLVTYKLQKAQTGEVLRTGNLEYRTMDEIYARRGELEKIILSGFELPAGTFDLAALSSAEKVTTTSPLAFKYYAEGRKYYMQGDFEQSLRLMEKAVEIDPQFAMAFRAMAGCNASLGKYDLRTKYIQKAFELSDRLPPIERYIIRGGYYAQSEKTYGLAIESYKKLLEVDPESIYRPNLISLYLTEEDVDSAFKIYETFDWQKNPGSILFRWGSIVLRAKGRYEEARKLIEQGLKAYPGNKILLRELVDGLVLEGDYDRALLEAEMPESVDPPTGWRPEWQQVRGSIYWLKGDFSRARAEFEKVTDIPTPFDIFEGRFKQALERIGQGLRLAEEAKNKPQIQQLHGLLGYVYFALGDSGKALAEQALSVPSPADLDMISWRIFYWRFRGQLLAQKGQWEEVRKCAEEVKKLVDAALNKKLIRVHDYLAGLIELNDNQTSKAIAHFEKAVSLLPKETNAYHPDDDSFNSFCSALALAYEKAGDLNKAAETYEKIGATVWGRLNGGHLWVKSFYRAGLIRERQGKIAEARDKYRKFLELWKNADPGIPEVEDARKRLDGLKVQ